MELQTSAPLPKPTSKVEVFELQLKKYERNIVDLLAAYGVSPKEFIVIATNAVKKNPRLLDCDPRSLFGSILTAAELGLRVNTPSQHCFIIPYGTQATFQMGYQGFIELMYRSPRVLSISAEIVYQNDYFKYERGINQVLEHRPYFEGDRGKAIGSYVIVKLADADPQFLFMSKDDIMKIKAKSKGASKSDSPWNESNDPMLWMWKKTVIKQIQKTIPKTNDVAKAAHIDNIFEIGGRVFANDSGDLEIVEPEISESQEQGINSDLE